MIVDGDRKKTARGIQIRTLSWCEVVELNGMAVFNVNVWKMETSACWNAISIPM
jgi:hypothetical protein